MINLLALSILVGCSSSGTGSNTNTTSTVIVQGASNTAILNPLALQQFANPLPIIPAATPDTATFPGREYYVVSAEQTVNYDFGLRKSDGSEIINPATGLGTRTTVWGYTINGVSAGYLGASIVARSTLPGETGKQVKVKYVNNLKNSMGTLLTKHLLTVDKSLDGANMGESEIRIVTHLHGGHVADTSDGHPLAWVTNDPAAATGLAANAVTGFPGRPNGNTFTYDYPNDQLAAHLWFHDHAMGITRLNVYAGLAANYLLRDSVEDGLNLPGGAYEIPLVIQDKSFNEDGSLFYNSNALLDGNGDQVTVNGNAAFSSKPEFFGNTIVVNGKIWPFLQVEPRKYRFRMLNGSDSRFYSMWLEISGGGAIPANAIKVIGNEGGLLPAAVTTMGYNSSNTILMATGERVDVIIDFSDPSLAGKTITLRNNAAAPYPGGNPVADTTTGRIMQFKVTKALAGADTSAAPNVLRAPVRPNGFEADGTTPVTWAATSATVFYDLQELMETNRYVLDSLTGTVAQRLKLLINGREFADPVSAGEKRKVNVIQDWVVINSTADMHPMHLHLVHFEVIEKGTILNSDYTKATTLLLPSVAGGIAGLKANEDDTGSVVAPGSGSSYTLNDDELGWKETVRVPPASADGLRVGYVRIRAKFDTIGTYMWHCHILAHEENEMMRPFMVIP